MNEHVLLCSGHQIKIPDIVKGQGIYVYDKMGKRYMDLESGTWCISVGHNNQRINEAITRQIHRIIHSGFCYSSKITEESAAALLRTAGFQAGKVVFLSSGSEAIEFCRQIAKHVTQKSRSLTLHDSYLGAYASVKNRQRDWFEFKWESCRQCNRQQSCDETCPKLQNIPDDIADFVLEPGSAGGFVRFPPESLVYNLVKIVKANGGVIIANEVTTGIGRTGEWYGFQHFGIQPDMIAVGKGLGNGYPVSAALIHRSILQKREIKSFKYAQSHQNDPLGAAVALAVVQEIETHGLVDAARENGMYLFEKLCEMADRQIVLAVRGKGLMLAVDFPDGTVTDSIYNALLKKGIIVGNRGKTIRIDPPLITSREDINKFLRVFSSVVKRTEMMKEA